MKGGNPGKEGAIEGALSCMCFAQILGSLLKCMCAGQAPRSSAKATRAEQIFQLLFTSGEREFGV